MRSGPLGVFSVCLNDLQRGNGVEEIEAVMGSVPSTSTVNTVSSVFNNPSGVAVDSAGNVFVADSSHNAVKEIVAVNGLVSSSSAINTVGGGFNLPLGVAVNSVGIVFVADARALAERLGCSIRLLEFVPMHSDSQHCLSVRFDSAF